MGCHVSTAVRFSRNLRIANWERPDNGRSFGFTGLHFHEQWKRIEYRRLVVQGILWTLGESIPVDAMSLNLTEANLAISNDSAK